MYVIDGEADFQRYWRDAMGADPATAPTQGIDWGREQLVAIHLGRRNTGGFSVSVQKIVRGTDDVARITALERTPPPGAMTFQAITSPYTIIRVQRGAFTYALDIRRQEAGSPGIGLITPPPGAGGISCAAIGCFVCGG